MNVVLNLTVDCHGSPVAIWVADGAVLLRTADKRSILQPFVADNGAVRKTGTGPA